MFSHSPSTLKNPNPFYKFSIGYKCLLFLMFICRCQIWKTRLGFTGTHRYARLTPDQSHLRIKICSLHFTENNFVNAKKNRIKKDVVPSLHLGRDVGEL